MLTIVDNFQMLIGSAQPKYLIYFLRGEGKMKINEKIYSLRKKNNLSQEELADKLNVSRQTVSKWELGESCPDFDKIVPLCELFGITTEQLLRDKNIEEKTSNEDEPDVKKALLICGSVFLYFLAIVTIILGEEYFHLNDGLIVSIFLTICGIATAIIIYTCMTRPGKKKNISEDEVERRAKHDPVFKGIVSIVTLTFTCLYLFVSFITMAWHITWILWVIYSLVIRIIELGFSLKGDNNE